MISALISAGALLLPPRPVAAPLLPRPVAAVLLQAPPRRLTVAFNSGIAPVGAARARRPTVVFACGGGDSAIAPEVGAAPPAVGAYLATTAAPEVGATLAAPPPPPPAVGADLKGKSVDEYAVKKFFGDSSWNSGCTIVAEDQYSRAGSLDMKRKRIRVPLGLMFLCIFLNIFGAGVEQWLFALIFGAVVDKLEEKLPGLCVAIAAVVSKVRKTIDDNIKKIWVKRK